MAEGILKFLHGTRIYVDSTGVRASEVDGFAIAVMDEIGIDIASHKPKAFEALEDSYFDLIISLNGYVITWHRVGFIYKSWNK